MNEHCASRAEATNARLAAAGLPVRIVRLVTIWTILIIRPGRYNWLLQYYLRAQGVTLTWVGTGRCLANMEFSARDYDDLRDKLVNGAEAMHTDEWWVTAVEQRGRVKAMRKGLSREVSGHLLQVPGPLQTFYAEVMRRKHDDHHASHTDVVNQLFHIISSSVFLGCYALALWDLTTAMWAGLTALSLRQVGHALFEPSCCRDREALLLGFNTPSKTWILAAAYLVIPVASIVTRPWDGTALGPVMAVVTRAWFAWTLVMVVGRVVYLAWSRDTWRALVWLVRLVTDPLTDLLAYSPRYLQRA